MVELPPGVFPKILEYQFKPTFSSCLDNMKPDLTIKPKHNTDTIKCLKLILTGTFWQFRFTNEALQQFNTEIKEIGKIDNNMMQLILAYVMLILKTIDNISDRQCIASRVMFSNGNLTEMAYSLWRIQRLHHDENECNRLIQERITNDIIHLRYTAMIGLI